MLFWDFAEATNFELATIAKTFVTDKIYCKEIDLYRFRIRGKKLTFFCILVGRNNS